MLIDWFTVVAQGLNFIVLVWLLKRYLYKPVLAAIDAREKHIAAAIAAADSQKGALEQERKAFEVKVAALDVERAAFLQRAVSAADAERARLLADARTDANSLREGQMAVLREEQNRLRDNIARLAQQEVLAIARKVLGDLAGTSVEERMVVTFLQRLHAMDDSGKEKLLAAFGAAAEAVVRSAFDLTEAQQALICSTVRKEFSGSVRLRFNVAPEMLCGVELLVGGQRISWSFADYMDGLEQRIAPLGVAPDNSAVVTIPKTVTAVLTA